MENLKGKVCVVVLTSAIVVYGRMIEAELESGMIALEKPIKLSSTLMPTQNGPQQVQVPEPLNPINNDLPLALTRSQYIQLHEAPLDLEKNWLQLTSGIDLGAG